MIGIFRFLDRRDIWGQSKNTVLYFYSDPNFLVLVRLCPIVSNYAIAELYG